MKTQKYLQSVLDKEFLILTNTLPTGVAIYGFLTQIDCVRYRLDLSITITTTYPCMKPTEKVVKCTWILKRHFSDKHKKIIVLFEEGRTEYDNDYMSVTLFRSAKTFGFNAIPATKTDKAVALVRVYKVRKRAIEYSCFFWVQHL